MLITTLSGTEKRATKNVQPVLHHCCKISLIAILRVLPPMFKPVNNLICCKTGLMWVVKRATSLFNSFCSNVAKQVARFLLPVFPYLTWKKAGSMWRLHSPFSSLFDSSRDVSTTGSYEACLYWQAKKWENVRIRTNFIRRVGRGGGVEGSNEPPFAGQ